MRKEKLWTAEFTSTSIVNFVLMLSMYLLLVMMAGYTIERYHASASMGGLVSSIFIIGVLIGRLYAGKKITKVGAKSILLIGIGVFVMMSFGYYFDSGVSGLIVIRIIQGIGLGFATTSTGTIVSQVIPSSRKGEGISYFSMSVVLSTALGPLIGIQLLNAFNYTSIFIFSTVIGTLCLVMAFRLDPPVIEAEEAEEGDRSFRLNTLFEKKAIPISAVLLILALGYAGVLSFITTYAAELGLTEAGEVFFLVYSIAVLVSRPFTGKLMDARGANSVAYPTIILFILGMTLLTLTETSFVFLLAAIFMGLGYGNFQSCSQAIAIKLTPIERLGLANSTYFIFLDIALGIGPLFLGLLEPIVGYRGMYGVLIFVIVCGLFAYYFLHGRQDQKVSEMARQT